MTDPVLIGGDLPVHPLIAGVVLELPKPGEPMSAVRRKQWLTAFEGILAMLYPESQERRGAKP